MKNSAYLSPAPAARALTDAHHTMTDPSPHAAAPLPNHFPWQEPYWGLYVCVRQALVELPVATEAILPARDREWVLRVFAVPYAIDSDRYHRFINNTYDEVARPLVSNNSNIEHYQERLLRPMMAGIRDLFMERIAQFQTRGDELRAAYARLIRDNLGLIEQYNRELYADFLRPEVQAVPDQIARAIAAEDWTELRNALCYFLRYAAYAPHGDIARVLDRLVEALTTRRLPAVPMSPPPDDPDAAPVLGSNWILQMHNLRDACRIFHNDPRARPMQYIPYTAYGVLNTEPDFEDVLLNIEPDLVGAYALHHTETTRLTSGDFTQLGGHMVRRARDRAWERVRERFARRLVSWARRYPESRLAALADAPLDVPLYIAALRFPYTPYPN
jgi:hypothetical protein